MEDVFQAPQVAINSGFSYTEKRIDQRLLGRRIAAHGDLCGQSKSGSP
jgi:hypothetical protein